MADLVELIFAEDNETLLRKDTKQMVDIKPIGKPRIESYNSCVGHLTSCGGSRAHKRDVIGISIGADAYVVGTESSLDKYGQTYYLFPVQFYKIVTDSGSSDE